MTNIHPVEPHSGVWLSQYPTRRVDPWFDFVACLCKKPSLGWLWVAPPKLISLFTKGMWWLTAAPQQSWQLLAKPISETNAAVLKTEYSHPFGPLWEKRGYIHLWLVSLEPPFAGNSLIFRGDFHASGLIFSHQTVAYSFFVFLTSLWEMISS